MTISTYQIQNVLRVYGKQLSQGKISKKHLRLTEAPQDKIDISTGRKRTAIIKKIASDIVDKIARHGPSNDMEAGTLKELEDEYGSNLSVDKDETSNNLIFKVVDKENNETIEVISSEDSDFLKQRLEEIAKSRIDENMFS